VPRLTRPKGHPAPSMTAKGAVRTVASRPTLLPSHPQHPEAAHCGFPHCSNPSCRFDFRRPAAPPHLADLIAGPLSFLGPAGHSVLESYVRALAVNLRLPPRLWFDAATMVPSDGSWGFTPLGVYSLAIRSTLEQTLAAESVWLRKLARAVKSSFLAAEAGRAVATLESILSSGPTPLAIVIFSDELQKETLDAGFDAACVADALGALDLEALDLNCFGREMKIVINGIKESRERIAAAKAGLSPAGP
jgi:hypothetical protein